MERTRQAFHNAAGGKTIRKVARKHGRVLLLGDGDEVLLQIAPNGGVYDKNGNYFKETL